MAKTTNYSMISLLLKKVLSVESLPILLTPKTRFDKSGIEKKFFFIYPSLFATKKKSTAKNAVLFKYRSKAKIN
jgi:hypothetical protein